MDYKYHQYQGQPSDQFHPKNKGKQVVVSLDIITEPDCEQNNTNDNNHTTDDINDTTITTEILNVNDTFKDWDAVETAVNMFAKYNGFVAIKFHKDLDIIDKTITRRRVYQCWKAGINNPNKVEDITLYRKSSSTKTNCPWQANFYFGKHAADIHLTKFNNSHNHQCNPVSIELASKNLRFSQSILDKIEHYTTKGVQVHDEFDAATMFLYLLKQYEEDLNYIIIPRLKGPSNELIGLFWITSKQCNKLRPKFHNVVIYDNTAKMNRYEMALSLFIGIDNNFKTRVLIQALTKYETQADYIWILQCTLKVTNNLSPHVSYTDGDPAMLAAVQVVYPQTRHLLYIYHIAENIKKKAKALLRNDMVQNFIKDFYHMRNSYTEYQFELRYTKMLTKYELCRSYLEKKLYSSHESWAKYAISKVFTAGVESTQRVESINGVLKKYLD
ncbi:unnamed protein product [Rhizophagus irregularis]|uniref:Protein far1-related sequence 11-like n=1 Tax=Rhizophagus irregularis TaxID=588596 RepID=A0A915YTQ2_9GLOM|nr:unnamed protein product [Rhizophagus irregularis]CAB5338034.1 unnamed protein product [Rhizophagus irregularis]